MSTQKQLLSSLPKDFPADSDLTVLDMYNFLSIHLLKREVSLKAMTDAAKHWNWFRCKNKTIVTIYGSDGKRWGVGWAEKSKKDPMNEYVGISVALVRALRSM
jgi:hypothetical protein